jgi:hypothetical protein
MATFEASSQQQNLPYETFEAGAPWLQDIKQGLCKAIRVGNYSPGVYFWLKNLQK